ncbi:hypothetical protein KFK09_019132 [Dendrobium nobile]|uniref:Uncharacterized protein n=1 Tax=Dendrobium nobile TaxID=94219 RepID=A0A8T3AXZ4_DENNO|nr:hypothetical protein KFK09_019132 [Dendrobium nobile]
MHKTKATATKPNTKRYFLDFLFLRLLTRMKVLYKPPTFSNTFSPSPSEGKDEEHSSQSICALTIVSPPKQAFLDLNIRQNKINRNINQSFTTNNPHIKGKKNRCIRIQMASRITRHILSHQLKILTKHLLYSTNDTLLAMTQRNNTILHHPSLIKLATTFSRRATLGETKLYV